MNVDTLLDAYKVDTAHARRVADHALALFDAVADAYGLDPDRRRLLEIGGLLHNVGLTTDPPAHHLVGRDIMLRHLIEGLSSRERALVACMVAFHRKKVRPRIEPAFLSLGRRGQLEALRLSAILRVADGLDYSQTQTTQIVRVARDPAGLLLHLDGAHAASDGARAMAKADLWRKVFDEELRVGSSDGSAPPAEDAADEDSDTPLLAPWYAAPAAPLAELGRVLLRRNLRRLLAAAREVRADESIEAVHNLRVATRRLRATLRLLAPVGPRAELREHAKAMGRLARAAGAVRDRDVLLADMAARADELPEALHSSLADLRATLEAERHAAHTALVAMLDGDALSAALKAFAATMNEAAGWDEGPRVRDLAGSTLWRHYEALRAHASDGLPAEEEALHAMRIEGKRLRYALELFADTLGTRVDEAVKPLISFQDQLGGLNDLAVARTLLAPHLAEASVGPAGAAYLALRERAGAQLRAELPGRWEKLNSGTYRRRLMEVVVRL
jgi:CHAD domain-containing protein